MTRYQLSIYAEKLPNRGLFRKPNPVAQVAISGGPRDGDVLGRTEVVQNTLEPDFVRGFFLETERSINMPLTVTIYNDRDKSVLAEATFEATEVFSSPGHFQVHKAPNGSKIYACIEESVKGTAVGECTLQFRGLDIRNVEPGLTGLGRSDPFFEVSRKNADHAAGVVRWNTIYRSAYKIDHLNPLWDKFTISLEELCYCDVAWPIKITVLDYNRNGKHVEIGGFETTVQELSQRVAIRGNADRERAFEISREDKNAGTTQGLMVVLEATIQLKEESSPYRENVPLEPSYPPASMNVHEA